MYDQYKLYSIKTFWTQLHIVKNTKATDLYDIQTTVIGVLRGAKGALPPP